MKEHKFKIKSTSKVRVEFSCFTQCLYTTTSFCKVKNLIQAYSVSNKCSLSQMKSLLTA